MSNHNSNQNGHSRQEKSKIYTLQFTQTHWQWFWEWVLLAHSLCQPLLEEEKTRSPRSQRFLELSMKGKAKRWLKIAARLDRAVFRRVKTRDV